MMNFLRWLWLLLCLIPSLLMAQGAETVPLYLAPDTSEPIYFRESLSVLEGYGARPHATDSDQNWWWVDYPGTYVGYVTAGEINKDMTLAEGALIRLRAAVNAPVIHRLDRSSNAELVSVEGDWATVFYRGTAPVYFIKELAAEADPTAKLPSELLAVEPGEEPAVGRDGLRAPRIVAFTFDDEGASTPLAEAKPEEAVCGSPAIEVVSLEDAPPSPQALAPTPEASPLEVNEPAVTRPTQPELFVSPGQGVYRSYTGQLRSANTFERMFRPSIRYMLVNADGDTLGYLDLSEAIRHHTMDRYLGRQILVTGETERSHGAAPLLIKARQLTLLR